MSAAGNKRRKPFVILHKMAAGVCLLAFLVTAISGFMAGSSVTSITYRMLVVTLVVTIISRVVVTIFQHSEEMSGGEG